MCVCSCARPLCICREYINILYIYAYCMIDIIVILYNIFLSGTICIHFDDDIRSKFPHSYSSCYCFQIPTVDGFTFRRRSGDMSIRFESGNNNNVNMYIFNLDHTWQPIHYVLPFLSVYFHSLTDFFLLSSVQNMKWLVVFFFTCSACFMETLELLNLFSKILIVRYFLVIWCHVG